MDGVEIVHLKPGIDLPKGFEVVSTSSARKVLALDGEVVAIASAEVAGDSDLGADVDVRMRVLLDPSSFMYEVQSVEIDRREGQGEITGSTVRAIRFRELLVWGVSRGLVGAKSSPFLGSLASGEMTLDEYESAIVIPRRPEMSRLELAASLYVVSRALGLPPLKRVAEVFGVSRSTAIRMVARARSESLLD